MAIWAYCQTANHVHLIAAPSDRAGFAAGPSARPFVAIRNGSISAKMARLGGATFVDPAKSQGFPNSQIRYISPRNAWEFVLKFLFATLTYDL